MSKCRQLILVWPRPKIMEPGLQSLFCKERWYQQINVQAPRVGQHFFFDKYQRVAKTKYIRISTSVVHIGVTDDMVSGHEEEPLAR